MARRLLAPDGAMKETEVPLPGGASRRYRANDGVYTVSDSDAAVMKAAGFTESVPGGTFRRNVGRRCTTCGFGSFFTTCSRCGGTCEKE